MNPALSQEFNLFCEQEQLQKHAALDKNPYCVYGTLKICTYKKLKNRTFRLLLYLMFKLETEPRASEHTPVRGGNVKTF